MKLASILVLMTTLSVGAQAQASAPDAHVATIDGRKVTAGELQALLSVLAPQAQQNFLKSPKAFLDQIGMLYRVTEMAEKAKLDQASPFKEQLAFQRMQILYNAQSNAVYSSIHISAEEVKKFYEANKDRYSQVRVKVIYVSFSSNPPASPDPKGKKILTESEAKAKAESLLGEIRAGGDFVKLAKQHSEDADSVARDAEFATIRKSDNIPDAIKAAIFSLKAGQVSEPVRQPNGFYLFRAEDVTAQPLDQVTEDIVTQARQARFNQWMQDVQQRVQVKIENPEFFKSNAAAPAK
ncbi:MAG: peptidyl-prolyl cis-trans isomerase [Acidobacteria bacterium]|nr:peptidyl-prolyl cis-trans isomerase [Acidobacteriota bacterium]